MKRKDVKELHNKEFGELMKMSSELRSKITDFKTNFSLGKEKNVAFKKELERDRARVLSILHMKRLAMPLKYVVKSPVEPKKAVKKKEDKA